MCRGLPGLQGTPATCAIDVADPTQAPTVITATALPSPPTEDGIYGFSYVPTRAGSYVASVTLTTSGGLLGTYYNGANLTFPMLASRGTWHDGLYHKPYWCAGIAPGNWSTTWNFGPAVSCDPSVPGCGCDSTRLDAALSFNWGTSTPLPYDELYANKFPTEFYSVQWTGYLGAPTTGNYTITLTADYGVQMVVNGATVINAVPMAVASASATVALTQGQLAPVTITYYHQRDAAYFTATWAGPGVGDGVTPQVIAPQYLYYQRNIVNSPLTIEVYPGAVSAATSSAVGGGLTNCTATQQCAFTVFARDAAGNAVFNSGAQAWNVTVYGTGDWAGYAGATTRRVNAVNYTGSVAHVNVAVQPTPGSWELVGMGSATQYANVLTIVNATAAAPVARGDTILVGQETMQVASYYATNGQPPYNANLTISNYGGITKLGHTVVPLARPYLGPSVTNVPVYRLRNCSTGSYLVTYAPFVRGTYQVNVQVPAVNEVQQVAFYTTGTGSLGGNYTLTAAVTNPSTGLTTAATTAPLLLGATPSTAAQVQAALNGLSNLAGVTVSAYTCTTTMCTYTVTFLNQNANLPSLSVGSAFVTGNELLVEVIELQAGKPSTDVMGSPFTLHVVPNATDAAYSVAYGRGVMQGTTGVPSAVYLQSKDGYGNNRLDGQATDTYRVHAFVPTLPYDNALARAVATVVPTGHGGYNASFTPLASGTYTVVPVLGTVLEVQNITADVSARSGSFILQVRPFVASLSPPGYD